MARKDGDFAQQMFTKVLQSIHESKYEPTTAEVHQLYRVLNETFHPLGVYWALFGGLSARLLFPRCRTLLRRRLLVTFSSALSYELSALSLDPHPCRTFVDDIILVDGKLAAIAASPTCLRDTTKWRETSAFLEFVTFERTLRALWSPMSVDPTSVWLVYFKQKWFSNIQRMDPFTKTYWWSKLWLLHHRAA